MRCSVFVGDLTDAPADALCTSTNPRLSLMMGTGGAVRERGGFEVLTAAQQLVSGRAPLPVGSVHVTPAGRLPYKAIIHCVASDAAHNSSEAVVRACVRNALAAADAQGCKRVAMPVFATGHARLKFDRSLKAMAEAIRDSTAAVEEVVIVVVDERHAVDAHKMLGV